MGDDDPKSCSPNSFNKADGMGPHIRDPPMEGEEMGADGVTDVESDGVQPWGPEGSSAPEPPGVGEGVAETEEDEAAR